MKKQILIIFLILLLAVTVWGSNIMFFPFRLGSGSSGTSAGDSMNWNNDDVMLWNNGDTMLWN